MNRGILLFLLLFLMTISFAGESHTLYLQDNTDNILQFSPQDETNFTLEISIGQIQAEVIQTPWGDYTSLSLPKFSGSQLEIGKAVLPHIHQLIEIPYDAEVEFRIISAESREIDLNDYQMVEPVLPYQGPIEKTAGALANHQFQMDPEYYQLSHYPEKDLITVEEAGNLRGHRLGLIKVGAVQYLPSQNKITIYHHIRIAVSFKNANLVRTREIHQKYQSPYFSPLLREFVLNSRTAGEDLTRYPVYYAIIYTDGMAAALQPLIDWKQQKGFHVVTQPISAIGNNSTAIQNYIQGLYNGPNPPSFVLLVGDYEQITSPAGQTGSHITDLYYTTMTVGDFVPDIYLGRLSAQSVSQLTPQIDKILVHEKYLFPQTAFLNHGCFVATDDGGNYTVAEGSHNYVINTHFIPNNLAYDKLYAITFGATGQQVINAVNSGRFILNYSGHGSTTSWGGPSVNQTMVRSTTNLNMYPFVISNACVTGSFQISECFGETWVRKADGGGLAFTGASNNTYWSEDDEWERRAYDGVFWQDYYSLAAFVLRGNLAVLNAGYNLARYYFEVYQLFGDPSVTLYWGEASPMTVNASNVIFIGSPTFNLTVLNEDSALASLSMDGTNYGSALTDANGQAQIQLNPVPTAPGNMLLTITKFNRQPFIDTLQVIPASGPYLYCLAPVIDDQATNNNRVPEAGERLNLGLLLSNVGVANAVNVQATLTCSEPLVTIHSGQSNFATIPASDTVIVGQFSLEFSEMIPHLSRYAFQLHMADNAGNSWDQTLYLQIHQGGKIAFSRIQVDFPNTFLTFTSVQNLNIQNTGPDTLWINQIQSTLPEFDMLPGTAQIAPGASRTFAVSFTPQLPQLYEAILSINSSDPVWFDTTITVTGTGIYAPDIAFSPDSISRQVHITDSIVIPIQIRNEGLGELTYNAQIAGYQNTALFSEGSGGSDNFGHIWIDSDEPGGPDFQWIDISQTGTELPLTGNNNISDIIPLGFTFPFYGQTFSGIRACTNGWLSFSAISISYNNLQLPNPIAPSSLIAPFWDDLNFTAQSKLFYQQEINKVIFTYQNVYRITGEGPLTFQAILYENGNIILQYLSLQNLVHDYTVGIQNPDGSDGLTIAHNQPYLKDSLAIIISKHSWATVSPLSGILAPQSHDTLYLTLRTHNFPMGEFWAGIQVESNDPDETISVIPIHMVVDSVTLNLTNFTGIKPENFQLYQNWPNPFNPSTTITYSLPERCEVRLEIFTTLGQKIRTLVSENQGPGIFQIQWDGRNEHGQPAASGLYLYRIQAGKQVAMRKMIYIR